MYVNRLQFLYANCKSHLPAIFPLEILNDEVYQYLDLFLTLALVDIIGL